MSWTTYVLIGLVVLVWLNLRAFMRTWKKDRDALWQALNSRDAQIAELSRKLEEPETSNDSSDLVPTSELKDSEEDDGGTIVLG